jgi:hypothetical protein
MPIHPATGTPRPLAGSLGAWGRGHTMDYLLGAMAVVAVIYAVVRLIFADLSYRKGGKK